MKKIFKRKGVSAEAQVEPDIAALMDKMQQQLNSLEGKVDILISQSSQRSSGGNNYSKPFQRFDKSQRFGRGDGRDNNFRERSLTKVICAECKTECEVPFKPTGDRPVYCKECFAKHKDGGESFKGKFERNPREGGFVKFRNFDNPQDRDNRRLGGRKKPGFCSRRGRG